MMRLGIVLAVGLFLFAPTVISNSSSESVTGGQIPMLNPLCDGYVSGPSAVKKCTGPGPCTTYRGVANYGGYWPYWDNSVATGPAFSCSNKPTGLPWNTICSGPTQSLTPFNQVCR